MRPALLLECTRAGLFPPSFQRARRLVAVDAASVWARRAPPSGLLHRRRADRRRARSVAWPRICAGHHVARGLPWLRGRLHPARPGEDHDDALLDVRLARQRLAADELELPLRTARRTARTSRPWGGPAVSLPCPTAYAFTSSVRCSAVAVDALHAVGAVGDRVDPRERHARLGDPLRADARPAWAAAGPWRRRAPRPRSARAVRAPVFAVLPARRRRSLSRPSGVSFMRISRALQARRCPCRARLAAAPSAACAGVAASRCADEPVGPALVLLARAEDHARSPSSAGRPAGLSSTATSRAAGP